MKIEVKFEEAARKLSKLSEKNFTNPAEQIEWPETLPQEGSWYFSPEKISLFGTPTWSTLSVLQQQRLSFFEAVNFFSLNIHGEKPLIEGMMKRIYRKNMPHAISEYIHHFIDEENKHMHYFSGFCYRYAAKIYPDKKIALPRSYLPGEEDFLFFSKIVIFEEIVDQFNIEMARDDRSHPLIRKIHQLHHDDESRHLAFGRLMVRQLFEEFKSYWGDLNLISEYLRQYIESVWMEYYNPEVYRDAQISNSFENIFELRESAINHATQIENRNRISQRVEPFFRGMGLLC